MYTKSWVHGFFYTKIEELHDSTQSYLNYLNKK